MEQLQAEVGVNVQLHGSIFLPSKQLLAQQRFRPWRGVFLSQEVVGASSPTTLTCTRAIHVPFHVLIWMWACATAVPK